MHVRLFNKPHYGSSGCTLSIAGQPASYVSGSAYEGRVQVSGAVGGVTLTSWTGDLPEGATVSFDNATTEVVIAWPEHSAGTYVDVENKNFEQGDVDWDKGAGWTIMQGVTAPDPNDPGSAWQAQFANQGGESEMMSSRAIPAVPGKTYVASVDVQQGKSSENHAGAAVRLRFFDAAGAPILTADGNVVKSGSGSHWGTSSVTVVSPASTAAVKLGVAAFRNHENEPLWADNLVWNGAYDDPSTAVGTTDTRAYPITVSVRDSNGCRATWVGSIRAGSLVGLVHTDNVYRSADGFENVTSVPGVLGPHMVWAGDRFVVANNITGARQSSPDGSPGSWTELPNIGASQGMAWTGSALLAVSGAAANSGIYRSLDKGATWTKVFTGSQDISDNITSVGGVTVVDRSGGKNTLQSLDDGETWAELPGRYKSSGLVLWKGKIYMLSENARIYVFDPVTGTWPSVAVTSWLIFSGDATADTMFVQMNDHVYSTTDLVTFTAVPGVSGANASAIVRVDASGNVWAVMPNGLYAIADGSATLRYGTGGITGIVFSEVPL